MDTRAGQLPLEGNEVGYVATDSANRVVITSTERLIHVPAGAWGLVR